MNRAHVFTGITPTLPHEGQGSVVGFFFFRGDNGAVAASVWPFVKLNCMWRLVAGQSLP